MGEDLSATTIGSDIAARNAERAKDSVEAKVEWTVQAGKMAQKRA